MNSLDQAAHAHGDLDPSLREMIRVRASQLNGCAYCLSVHNEDARKAGEDQTALTSWPAGARPVSCTTSANARRWRSSRPSR